MRNVKSLVCDSIFFSEDGENSSFSLYVNAGIPVRRYYSGNLSCIPDLGTLLLINECNIENYIAGVVVSEGGNGKNPEYFKTQAVIARTYMYRHIDKHLTDGYNMCDNTHCQVFNGLCTIAVIQSAVLKTKGEVILSKDSTLIIAAFHSNCGGETASSEDVWLTSQPYLKKIDDPYCITSKNATWEKRISKDEWYNYIAEHGYEKSMDDGSGITFIQKSRLVDYRKGSFTMPLKTIRSEMNLRSSFFSLIPDGDTILIKGRGYGHGVGLCQEGAMTMAAEGFTYRQIIGFYYSDVIITDIKNAIVLSDNGEPEPWRGWN